MKNVIEVNFYDYDNKLLEAFCSYGSDYDFSPSYAVKVLIKYALHDLGYFRKLENIDNVKP
ncbi:MAG: hypothetical protein II056_03240 [Paludibacteraceae bacterium]|nr:hypothetical protein [Paludibacteraceae bacterium]